MCLHLPSHFALLPLASPMQTLVLYDYDWASANDEIGRAFVKLSDLQPGQTRDLWLEVASEGEPLGGFCCSLVVLASR